MREVARSLPRVEVEPRPQKVEIGAAIVASPDHPEQPEDSFAFDKNRELAVLSDGMGGVKGGAVASSEAVRFVMRETQKIPASLSADAWKREIDRIMRAASEHIKKIAKEKGLPGMGATLEVVKVVREPGKDPVAVFGHLGDSSIFEVGADGQIDKLSRTDSFLGILAEEIERERDWRAAQIRAGKLPQDANDDLPREFHPDEMSHRISLDALIKVANSTHGRPVDLDRMRAMQYIVEEHHMKSIKKTGQEPGDLVVGEFHDLLTQAVGGRRVEPQVRTRRLRPGSKIAVVSDGITKGLSREQIGEIVASYSAAESAKALVRTSQARDDRSAVILGESARLAKSSIAA